MWAESDGTATATSRRITSTCAGQKRVWVRVRVRCAGKEEGLG